jgi:hypothetical protein
VGKAGSEAKNREQAYQASRASRTVAGWFPDEATAADRDPAPNHRGQEPAAAAASTAIARRLQCLMTSILKRPVNWPTRSRLLV